MSPAATPALRWQWARFSELTTADLYQVLLARQDVFILEQTCLYADLDDRDQDACHFIGWAAEDGDWKAAAYARVLLPGTTFAELSIGRVLINREYRGLGIGKRLLTECLRVIEKELGQQPIRIGAQAHLKQFYEEFGFREDGQPYLEDGIPHIEMLRKVAGKTTDR